MTKSLCAAVDVVAISRQRPLSVGLALDAEKVHWSLLAEGRKCSVLLVKELEWARGVSQTQMVGDAFCAGTDRLTSEKTVAWMVGA
jgi:hypothetical protein